MGIKITKVDNVFIEQMNEFRKPDKSVGLIEACSKNVVVFAERMLGMRLYAWQVYFLNNIQKHMRDPDGLREFLAMTGRQQGKSVAVAIFVDWCAVFNKYPAGAYENTSVLVVSASDTQAKKLLKEMKKMLILGDKYLEHTYKDEDGEPIFGKSFFTDLLSDNEANNTTTITFKAHNEELHGPSLLAGSKFGSTIKSYPATSSVLGETAGIIIIDEAGKYDKITDEFFYEFLYPVGNSTNAVRIYISTAWQPAGFFYRMADPENMYEATNVDTCAFTIDAIQLEVPDYYKTVMKTVKAMQLDGRKDEVQRAYYCKFVKGESSYFDPEDVRKCFSEEISKKEKYPQPCDMGVDFGGQVKSKTVITISTYMTDNTIVRLYHRVYPVGEDESLMEDIAELFTKFNIQRIVVDDCAAGQYIIKQMEDKGWDVQRMSFRAEKIKKYGAFRAKLHKNRVLSYLDEELKTEMYAMEYTPTSRQSNIQHASGYSDDLIDSFIMSTYFYIEDEDSITFFDWNSDEDDILDNNPIARVRRKRSRI